MGYFLFLVVVTPAFSVDVFFALIGATSRQHDLLAIVRAVSRMLLSVTSPYKIGLTLLALLGVFLANSGRRVRGYTLLIAALFGSADLVQLLDRVSANGIGSSLTMMMLMALTMISLRHGAQLIGQESPNT